MLHEKSLLSYLLAVVAMATVGCDGDTVNHDVFTKADGTLNLCGTFDANETIVEKGDVVKNVRVINSERYEYTCAQFDENNSKCLGIERKICKNDNFDEPDIFVIREIQKNTVTLDGNHPFAGKDLTFEVDIIDIAEPSITELETGIPDEYEEDDDDFDSDEDFPEDEQNNFGRHWR